MISGNDYKGLYECGYLDANLQNAEDMNLNCIKDKSKGEEKLCTSDYRKIYDNIAFNSQFISIKRGMNAGYGIRPYNSDEITNNKDISKISGDTIEGYTNYPNMNSSFVVPSGPGEVNIEEKCREGFTYDGSKCVQVCTNCKYRDGMKSQEFNEYDKCFPEGVYNGVNKDGLRRCNCGKNNQYCSDKFLNNFYPAGGFLSDIKNFNFTDLFDIRNL